MCARSRSCSRSCSSCNLAPACTASFCWARTGFRRFDRAAGGARTLLRLVPVCAALDKGAAALLGLEAVMLNCCADDNSFSEISIDFRDFFARCASLWRLLISPMDIHTQKWKKDESQSSHPSSGHPALAALPTFGLLQQFERMRHHPRPMVVHCCDGAVGNTDRSPPRTF